MYNFLKRNFQCELKSCGRYLGYILVLFTILGILFTIVYIDLVPDIHTLNVIGTLNNRTSYLIRDVITFVEHGSMSGKGHNSTLFQSLENKTDTNNVSLSLLRSNMNCDKCNAGEITGDNSLNTSENQFEVRNNWDHYKSTDLKIYILSAIGSFSAQQIGYSATIKLNGWQYITHKSLPIKCCILWTSKNTSEFYNPRRTYQHKRIQLLGTQISCPIKGPLLDVSGVALQYSNKKCPDNSQVYIRPLIPIIPSKNVSLVICLKLLYGQINNMALIYWIEFYIEMGADKIFMFVYNIGNNTKKILTHYYNLGVLEWRRFNFPMKSLLGQKVPVFWEDEQVLVYDVFSRFHGYTYLAIVDLDEYLLPRKHNNLIDMMANLTKTYPDAAGFTVHSCIFNKKWGISGRHQGTMLEKFVKRTHLLTEIHSRRKNILLPKRVLFDSFFHTHTYTPKDGYKRVMVKSSVATINHYRACYASMRHVCHRKHAIIDKEILKVVEKIKPRTKWFAESMGEG